MAPSAQNRFNIVGPHGTRHNSYTTKPPGLQVGLGDKYTYSKRNARPVSVELTRVSDVSFSKVIVGLLRLERWSRCFLPTGAAGHDDDWRCNR